MFLANNDILSGGMPLFCKWIRLFPSDQTKYLVVIFSLSIHVYGTFQDKLVLFFRQSIQAPILELDIIPRDFPSPDRLILLLNDCNKVTVMECMNFKFVNVELHHYPEHEYRLEVSGADSTDELSRLAVDPEGRCVALRLFRNYLTLIPQSIDSAIIEEIDRIPSWVSSFTEIDERFRSVQRVAFLSGYIEPTFAILGSNSTQTTGKFSTPKDQTWFAIVTVQLMSQKFNTIYYLSNLPNDLCELLPILRPTGGILAYGPNSIIHIEQGSPGTGLSLNSFALRLSSFKYSNFSQKEICLYNMNSVCLNENTVLFGAGYVLTLKKSGRFVSKLELRPLENLNASILALDNNSLVCCGKDALSLMKIFQRTSEAQEKSKVPSAIEDTDLYLAEISEEVVASGQISFATLDTISCADTVRDFTINNETGEIALITDSGSFILIPHRLPYDMVTGFDMPDAQNIWTISLTDSKHLLLISTLNSTLVLIKDKDRIREVESSDFYLEGPTLFIGSTTRFIVQVTGDQVILLDPSNFSMVSSWNGVIEKAAVWSNYIGVLDANYKFSLFSIADEDGKFTKVNEAKDLIGFDFDPTRRALWAIDKGGVLSCLAEPFSSVIFLNSNFSALPPVAFNHLKQPSKVKSSRYLVTNLKCCSDFIIVSNEHQISIYRILEASLIKVFSKITSGAKECLVFDNFVIILGSEPLVVNLTSLYACNLDSSIDSISFLSRDSFVAVNRAQSRISICTVSDFLKWSPILGPHYISHLTEGFSHILFHPASGCYIAVSRTLIDWNLPSDEYSGISDQQDAEVAENGPMPQAYTYKLHIISSLTWTIVDSFALREYETVLELRLSTLDTKQTSSGHKVFITVGTALSKGEDRPVRGRALVLDVVEVVPEPGRPETNVKLRLLTGQEVKGPVTTHCDIDGCLLVAMAGKVIIHALENDDALMGIAFVDTGVASISAAVIKNYFIVGDVNMGVSFYAFQKEPPKIALLGRGMSHSGYIMEFRSVEFCINGRDVLIIGADHQISLLHFYSYSPLDRRSGSGQKLLYLGCLKLLSPPVKLLRATGRLSKKHCMNTLVLCADGTIKRISPVDDIFFTKGLALTSRFVNQLLIPQAGGVLPRSITGRPYGKAFDLPHNAFSLLVDLSFNHRNVLDLTRPQQFELSKVANLDIYDLFQG